MPRSHRFAGVPVLLSILLSPALSAVPRPEGEGGAPKARALVDLAPGVAGVQSIDTLLKKGKEGTALELAERAWTADQDAGAPSRSATAALMALKALALAAKGEEMDLAVCLWQAAESVEPAVSETDLTPYRSAGQHLERNRRGADPYYPVPPELEESKARPAAEDGDKVTPPELVAGSQRVPATTRLQKRRERRAFVIVEAVIDEEGKVRYPRILRAEGPLLGFDLAGLAAFCHWRFKPAQLRGQPVKVYWSQTFDLHVER